MPLDQDLLETRGLEKHLLMGFSGDSPQRRRRHRWRASDAGGGRRRSGEPAGIARGSRGLRPSGGNAGSRVLHAIDARPMASKYSGVSLAVDLHGRVIARHTG